MGHVVQRTCLGCRTPDGPDHLVRLTVRAEAPGVVVVDYHRTLGGRGAWLHPASECVEKAVRRRAFCRAFRSSVDAQDAVNKVLQQNTQLVPTSGYLRE
ncbi:MAG: YlxR family protein [Kocuria sp.]|nr:YlxR family protein [Kocuria sp.]